MLCQETGFGGCGQSLFFLCLASDLKTFEFSGFALATMFVTGAIPRGHASRSINSGASQVRVFRLWD
jgi:hypothetical protein